jgi:hypothetical protein
MGSSVYNGNGQITATSSADPGSEGGGAAQITGSADSRFVGTSQISDFLFSGSLNGAVGSSISATLQVSVDTNGDGIGDNIVFTASFSATCVQSDDQIVLDFTNSGFVVDSENDNSFEVHRDAGTDLDAEHTIVTIRVEQTVYSDVGIPVGSNANFYES